MATWAIGDIQGCYKTFMRLVKRIHFRRGADRLWLVGDLVNRGPRNVEVLRWLAEHDDSVVVVLGNHDIHLLARADGVNQPKRRDTLEDVLEAGDRDWLINWLRHRPLLHRESHQVLVHAGLLPEWDIDKAEKKAREVEAAVREGRWGRLLEGKLASDLRVFTRLRMLDRNGEPVDYDGSPTRAPAGYTPWFAAPRRRSAGTPITFGHWSALGLYLTPDCVGLDTGCVWGRSLTAIRVEDRFVVQEPSAED